MEVEKAAKAKRRKICLNMVVCNQADLVERAINSVKHLIDSYVIIDTGSTDGTQDKVKEALKGFSGELIQSPWVDFAHHRNEALLLSKKKADYVLSIDADEIFVITPRFVMPELTQDFYVMNVHEIGGVDVYRAVMIKTSLNWQWQGAICEEITSTEAQNFAILLESAIYSDKTALRVNSPHKYRKEAQLLEKELEKNPSHARNTLMLARCYEGARDYEAALKAYEKRANMAGSGEEVFFALYSIVRMQEALKVAAETITTNYYKVHTTAMHRLEPLYRLATLYLRNNNPIQAYVVASYALKMNPTQDLSYVERWIYEYGMQLALGDAAFALGKQQEALVAYKKAVTASDMPNHTRKMVLEQIGKIENVLHPVKFEGTHHEFKENKLDLIAKFLPENPVIIEAGAHRGSDSIKLARTWPQGTVISFEPNPASFANLAQNVKSMANVQAHNMALADAKGTSELFVGTAAGCEREEQVAEVSSTLEPTENLLGVFAGPKLEVSATVLDSWCKENKINQVDLLRLDVEGAELQILKSSPIAVSSAKVIYTPTYFQEKRKGMGLFQDLKGHLESQGFTLLSHWYAENNEGEAIFIKNELLEVAK